MLRFNCFLGFALVLPPIAGGVPQDVVQNAAPTTNAVAAREKQVPRTKEEEARIEPHPIVAELVKSLRSHDVNTRIVAIKSFGFWYGEAESAHECPDARNLRLAAQSLMGALGDKDQSVQLAAAKALGEMGPGAASQARALADALLVAKGELREEICIALTSIGPAALPALPILLRALESRDDEMRSGRVRDRRHGSRREGGIALTYENARRQERGCPLLGDQRTRRFGHGRHWCHPPHPRSVEGQGRECSLFRDLCTFPRRRGRASRYR